MARWIKFTRDHDHLWPSRSVTAFTEGMTVFVKAEVADPAIHTGAAEPCDKPETGHVTTPTAEEGQRPPDGDA